MSRTRRAYHAGAARRAAAVACSAARATSATDAASVFRASSSSVFGIETIALRCLGRPVDRGARRPASPRPCHGPRCPSDAAGDAYHRHAEGDNRRRGLGVQRAGAARRAARRLPSRRPKCKRIEHNEYGGPGKARTVGPTFSGCWSLLDSAELFSAVPAHTASTTPPRSQRHRHRRAEELMWYSNSNFPQRQRPPSTSRHRGWPHHAHCGG